MKKNTKKDQELINEIKRHTEILTNVETATNINIISEGAFSGRGVHATLCCSSIQLGYWQSTCPLPAVITAANGNRAGKYITHNKMTIDGRKPVVGDYFRAVESRNGTPTGDHPNVESSGLIYKVMSVTAWDLGKTYNFPSANGCPSCPVLKSWYCTNPQGYVDYVNGTCSEHLGNCGAYETEAECPCTGPPPMYNCVTNGTNGSCVPVTGGGGQYIDLPTCQAACVVKERKICAKICATRTYANYWRQELCQDSVASTIGGQEPQVGDIFKEKGLINQGQSPAIVTPWDVSWRVTEVKNETHSNTTNFQPVPDCKWHEEPVNWACKDFGDGRILKDDGKVRAVRENKTELSEKAPKPPTGFKCVKDPMGPYTSQQQCQDACGQEEWACTSPGNCTQQSGGPHSSEADCLTNCAGVIEYNCVGTNCQPANPGTFNAGPTSQDNLTACQQSCGTGGGCNSVLSNWGWWQSIQQNGPKPCNSICNQIENVINDVNPTAADTCMMNYAITQAVAGGCTCQAPSSFITAKTTHHSNQGCCGELSNQPGFGCPAPIKPNTVCDWWQTNCPGTGWLKQTKCDWLQSTIIGPQCNNCL